MKIHGEDISRFRELFNAASENRLTDADHAEWNTLLQNDPDARRAYLHLATLRGTLHQRLAGAEAASADSASDLESALAMLLERSTAGEASPPAAFRLPRPFWPVAASILFAITLLLGFIQLQPTHAPGVAVGYGKNSAVITGLINVAWEDPGLAFHLRDALPGQHLHLRAGLVRVELPTG